MTNVKNPRRGEYTELLSQPRRPLPIRLITAVLRQRRMLPAGRIYLAALGVGFALGVLAQLVFAWPWWPFPIVLPAAVFLFFASTAFWTAAVRRDTASALLWALSPRRAAARERRLEAERLRGALFPLYGLPPSWRGHRHLASSSWTRGPDGRTQTTSLGLGHGDRANQDAAWLEVESLRDPSRTLHRRDLADRLWLETEGRHGSSQEVAAGMRAAEDGEQPDPGWEQTTITVDGVPRWFGLLAREDHWAAYAELDDHAITLYASRFPLDRVELVRITDVEPYIAGDAAQSPP